jgi:type I restriction enzyme, S subunit
MSLPRYPAYKASGVEWFCQVPDHWQAKRLKTEASYWVSNVDKIPSDDELPVRLCNYTDVYYNDQITPDLELMETTATAEEIRKFGLRLNDVLITKDSEEWSDIAVPAMVAGTAPDLVCGYHLAIIRPTENRLYGKFLLRVLQSTAVNQQFQIAASGVTRYGLPKSSIGEAWLPLPPLEEQQTIADFLDAQTAKIDTLLVKKRQFIEKLKEKRGALIACTVTRGLPPDAAKAAGLEPHPAMKDSGVEWLGKIPAHWEVKKGRLLGVLLGSASPSEEDFVEDEEGIPYAKVDDLNYVGASLELSGTKARILGTAARWKKIILFPKRGAAIFTNKVVLADGFFFDSNLMGWEIDKSHDSKFVAYCLIARRLDDLADVSTVPQINNKHIYPAKFPCPQQKEQRAIAAYLDHETARIDQLAAKVEAAIARLTEYHQALITAAVTGKFDVRSRTVG